MIAFGLACFLAGLMVGLSIGVSNSRQQVRLAQCEKPFSGIRMQPSSGSTKQSGVAVSGAKPAPQVQPFRLRRSWKDYRSEWEAQHNKKAQMNLSLAEQIRKAKEGTLQ